MASQQKLKDIFSLIDSDGGGAITVDEVLGFVAALPNKVSDDVVQTAFKTQDSDGSGEIDKDEFCGLAEKLQEATGVSVEEMVQHFTTHCYKDLFNLFAEGADEVRMSDLRTLVESMGTKISGEELRRIFLKYDEDGSGQIEFDEFIGIVATIGEGMPISTLVHDFKEARQEAKERMMKLKGAFAEKEETEPVLQKKERKQPASVKSHTSHVCQVCPTLNARIAELEALLRKEQNEVNTLKDELQAKESGTSSAEAEARTAKSKIDELEGKVKTLEEKLKKKEGRKKPSSADKENKELLSKCERLERQVAALQAAGSGGGRQQEIIREWMSKCETLERQLEEMKNSDLGLLQSQLWSLETALDIRTRELNALRDRTQEFAKQMERYDPNLAHAMRDTVRELAAKAEKEAMQTLGESVEAVVKNRKSKRKMRKSGDSEEQVASKNREIEALEAENKRLQRIASEAKRSSRGTTQVVQQAVPMRDDREIEHMKAKHREEIQKKDKDLAAVFAKLRNAQDAIVAAAGAGYENDVKLHQARKSLQFILDKGGSTSPTGSSAGSPAGSFAGSPAGSPRSAASPRSTASGSPQYSRTMHVQQLQGSAYSSPVRSMNERSSSPYDAPAYTASRAPVHSPPPPAAAYQSPVRRYQ
eukprot:TRINITY_DN11142_c0_g1_i1.p1 TRINITY_DN11142_c0_g1~~TRINITY_DN11142_c0_g1_i1.p1  ORF type:complete len:647 (+),score=183.73 TRINITY_DN11142_c0_g1_i1:41-1981(+)